ncbi:hypothetical protein N44_00223 [Microcystis aeruginosa NIES-44]|uniref:Uncharacterized protein n=1 Tax=Microcystis aeruginosa NIES-44 TaxID=449439 RepID=A0A0A1VQF2_MICAE|nr:hypothetical protein N44_00223 [Microcystis aeruginosa NIES-44]
MNQPYNESTLSEKPVFCTLLKKPTPLYFLNRICYNWFIIFRDV